MRLFGRRSSTDQTRRPITKVQYEVRAWTKISDEEVIAVLKEDYQTLPAKKLKKPIPKEAKYLTPLTSGNQNVLVPLVAGLSGAAYGYDMGIGKPLIPLMKHDFNLNCHQEDTIFIAWIAGALLAGSCGGVSIDTFGRRFTMILSLVILTFGSILSTLANHYILFLAARFICGFSGTVSAISHCIYIAEVSHKRKRGSNVTLHQIGTASGLLLATIIATKGTECRWRLIIGLTSVPALISCITIIIFLQRSPSFVLLKKFCNMPKHVNQLSTSIPTIIYVLKTYLIVTYMLFLRQGSGRQQVLLYAPRLFALLGMCPDDAEVAASIALGIIKVFSTLLSLVVVERCGRRTALITSATICMTAISLLSLLATMDRGDDSLNFIYRSCKNIVAAPNITEGINNPNMKLPIGSPPPFPLLPTPLAITAPNAKPWTQIKTTCESQTTSEGLNCSLQTLAVITLFVYESAYALGLGPVPLLILCEVFPTAVRGRSVGIHVTFIWLSHYVLSTSLSQLPKLLTLAGAYLLYSFVCLLAICYIFLLIPETKRKSINQIAHEIYRVPFKVRICENLISLPLVCHIEWVKKYGDNASTEQSTPI